MSLTNIFLCAAITVCTVALAGLAVCLLERPKPEPRPKIWLGVSYKHGRFSILHRDGHTHGDYATAREAQDMLDALRKEDETT